MLRRGVRAVTFFDRLQANNHFRFAVFISALLPQ